MSNIARKIDDTNTPEPPASRFARGNSHSGGESITGIGAPNALLPTESDATRVLGLSIFQFIGSSLQGGPRGIHPSTHLAALAALSGYAARHIVSTKISRNELCNDFNRLNMTRTKSVVVSEQVNRIVVGMDGAGVAGIVVGMGLRCGLTRVPDANALLHRHLSDPSAYGSQPAKYAPEVPAETLLMMYWEQVARFFRAMPGDPSAAPLAAAHAIAEAISVYRDDVPPDTSVEFALLTAIAMSKIDRAF